MRFSLAHLLAFIVCVCCLFALARWEPTTAVCSTPAILGPLTSTAVVRTKRAALLGVFSAYFWSLVLAVPIAMPAIYVLLYAGITPAAVASVFVVITSSIGGFLGGRVEQSRIEFESRRRTGIGDQPGG
jgi:hypothetical protein